MLLLLVEDHDDTRRAMETLLRLSGHRVTAVASGEEAVTAAAADRFDCAVVDLGLPDMSGLELYPLLAARGLRAGIALTGNTSPADVALCEQAGFTLHLPKPVMFEDVEAALARIQTGKHGPA
jgi:CheY-like chemotaxis protein